MGDSGWQTVKPDNLTFIVRRICSDTEFKILLSDIVRLWIVEGTAHDLLTMCQKENPLCEFEESKVIKNIFNLFDKNLHSLKVEKVENASRELKMCASLGNMPFNMSWHLKEETPDALYKEVTYPLLLTVQDLTLRQDHLCRIVKQKDAEIMDYISINGPSRWGKTRSDNELFIESQFKADKFVDTPQNRADPFDFTHNSDLLSVWNTKLKHDDQSNNACSNGVKTEPMESSTIIEESQSHSSLNLKIKREHSESQSSDARDVKPKVEIAESRGEQKTSTLNEVEPKPRRKVKLNI